MEIVLNERQICDWELLINGGFSPLKGFLKKKDYESVLQNMRLSNGKLWVMPITLPITEKQADLCKHYKSVKIKHNTGLLLGEIKLESDSIFQYNWRNEAKHIFGTDDDNHPYTKILKDQFNRGYTYYLGGDIIEGIIPPHYDFSDIRLSPKETKDFFKKNNWNKVVGFQTRNPMHRSHYELTKYALRQVGEEAKVLIHPVVGVTQSCDVDYYTRVRCYQHLIKYYPENTAKLSLLNLSMRMAGPREAVWHAQIRKNYGCTHFVVGRDHAGPSYKTKKGESFFGPYQAQELLMKYADEIGIKVIVSKLIVYAINKETNKGIYLPIDKIDKDEYEIKQISGTQQREMLNNGDKIPEWFSFPKVIDELKKEFKPLYERGLCIYLVGLSGSGKTTLANALIGKLKEKLRKKITYLDGDIVRTHLSKGLGFNRNDRSTNVRRIGYVASQVVRHDGVCVVANIAPYQDDREFNRNIIENEGNYFQIWVNTPLDKCEKRDAKGLYKLARQGKIKEFTGISDPFETPSESELIVDGDEKLNKLVDIIFKQLIHKKYI